MENQIQKFKKENNDNQLANYKKLQSQLKLISEGQEISRDEMRRGFIGLAQQNQELVKLNKQLTQQLETVVEELNQIKQERKKKPLAKKLAQIENVYPSVIQ
jgi:anion-transporting  ArsA/GET3 family ATPase